MSNNFISEIKIDKLRHLKNINIKISDTERKHLLLTGKNGVGKTTILEAMRNWLRAIQNGNISDVYGNYGMLQRLFDNMSNCNNDEKTKILSNVNNIVDYLNRVSENGLILYFIGDNDKLVNKFKKGDFIIAYYGANRKTNLQEPHGVEKVELNQCYGIESNASTIFIKYLVDLKTQQAYARNEGDLDVVDNIQHWFDRFENALRSIFDDKSIKLKYDYKNYNFELLQNGKEPFGLNGLSEGYSSIINILSDLILRMDQNRASDDRTYIYDKEGIVLIDELETHLHIELQKKILPFLTEFFPKIQFIVTTHSPFVLNSIENAVIYDLEKNIRTENLCDYSYEGIVEGYFNVDNYSNELKNIEIWHFQRIYQMMIKQGEQSLELN